MRKSSWKRGAALWLMASLSLAAMANDAPTVITLVEGKGTLASGIRTFVPAAGVKLSQCDVVRTAEKSMVQLEFPETGKIELGADTRFLADLPPAAGADAGERSHFLRSGWIKLTLPKRNNPKPQRIQTPYFDLVMEAGVAVLNVANGGVFFVQEGKALALDRAAGGAARVGVAAGQTYSRKASDAKPAVADRVDPALVNAMPRSFRDTVPSLLASLKGRDVQPKPMAGYDHAEFLAWQKIDAGVRQCLGDIQIRSAQSALQQAGIDVGPIDAVLGPRTQSALREFQKQKGLAQSGQLDESTLKALNAP